MTYFWSENSREKSGGMYGQVPRVVAVAILVVLVEPDQQPVLH